MENLDLKDPRVLDALDIAYQKCATAKSAQEKDGIISLMEDTLGFTQEDPDIAHAQLADYIGISNDKFFNAKSSKQKSWIIDRLVRKLTGNEYQEWVDRFEYDDDDPSNINIWETGEEP